jgi:ABC-type microcin C transport system permease subunit YejB
VTVLLVLPIIVQTLPSSVGNAIMKFLPFNISETMTSVRPQNVASAFHPWEGFAILCGYALIALVVGGILMVRRDS